MMTYSTIPCKAICRMVWNMDAEKNLRYIEAAYAETSRVLKDGGIFCGCFYVKGSCRRTDWFIIRTREYPYL